MNTNFKRPKRIDQEDEDDLLAFQEEFLKNKASQEQPAAKVVRMNPPKETKTPKKPSAEFDFETDDKVFTSVFRDIQERPVGSLQPSNGDLRPAKGDQLAKIEKLDLKQLSESVPAEKRKNKSLFALNLERQGKLRSHFNLENIKTLVGPPAANGASAVKSSVVESNLKHLITGDGLGSRKEAEQIHAENMERLAKLSQEEILAEQKKLLEQLDPKIVSFIRRGGKAAGQAEPQPDKPPESKVEGVRKNQETILDELPFKPDKKWLHMDKIEYDKLEWMLNPKKVVAKSSSSDGQTASASARFDFAGNILPPDEEVPVTKALHHHGNEPEKAGYSLDELFHLARSKFNQQRVLALQTLANIIRKCHQGAYYDTIRAAHCAKENESKDDDDALDENQNDSNNLNNQLVDGGVLFLLRWNLDDQTESIVSASLAGIKSLLQPPDQELYLDLTFDLYKGHEQACLRPFTVKGKVNVNLEKLLANEDKDEASEMDDSRFIKQDLIKGLFRMNLAARLRYLVDQYEPSLNKDLIYANIFSILYRCVRHSPEICYELVEKHSELINAIVRRFLLNNMFSGDSDDDQAELQSKITNAANAIKLLRLLAAAGPSLAFKLCHTYEIKTRVFNYLSIAKYLGPEREKVSYRTLQTECVRFIKVLLAYEPAVSADSDYMESFIKDCFAILLELVSNLSTRYVNSLKRNEETTTDSDDWACLRAGLSFFNILISKIRDSDPQDIKLVYEMCSSVFKIVQPFVQQVLEFAITKSPDSSPHKLNQLVLSCSVNFMVDFLEKCAECCVFKIKVNFLEGDLFLQRLAIIEQLIESVFHPILNDTRNSYKFETLFLSKLQAMSTVTTSSSGSELIRQNFLRIRGNCLTYLPTLNMINGIDAEHPVVAFDPIVNSPFVFLASFLRLYLVCLKTRPGKMDDQSFTMTRRLLNNSNIKSYLKAFVKNSQNAQGDASSTNSIYLMSRYENMFVYYLVKLAMQMSQSELPELQSSEDFSAEKRLIKLAALHLVPKFKMGEECFVNDLISSCLLNVTMWSGLVSKATTHSNYLAKLFEKLTLTGQSAETPEIEFSHLNYNYGKSETIKITKSFVQTFESTSIYENLNHIKTTFLSDRYLFEARAIKHSADLNSLYGGGGGQPGSSPSPVKTLFLSNSFTNAQLLDVDWMFLPLIVHLRVQEMEKKRSRPTTEPATKKPAENEEATRRTIRALANALKYIYLLEIYYDDDYMSAQNMNFSHKYIRLLYVYMLEPEIFLDRQIATLLYLIFLKYANEKSKPLEHIDFNRPCDSIISFYDFYQNLLGNYDSSSFGDYLFSLYLVVPLQQQYSVRYRQLFWSDFSSLVKFIRFDTPETRLLLPMVNYARPNEKSIHLIRLFSQLLLDPSDYKTIRNSRFAYTIVLAHLNSFLFEHVNKSESQVIYEFKKLLFKQLMLIKDEKFVREIIHFKCVEPSTGEIECFNELPSIRSEWFKQLAQD